MGFFDNFFKKEEKSPDIGYELRDHWICPNCGMVLEKDKFLMLIPPYKIQGTNTCPCGASYKQEDVYSGKYDYPLNKKKEVEKTERKQHVDTSTPIKTLEQLRAENSITDEDWMFRAIPLISDQKYNEAIECYKKALEINPKCHGAWDEMSNVFDYKRNIEEAIVCINKAIEIDPKNVSYWIKKGNYLREIEKYPEALVCFNKVLELDTENDEAKFQCRSIKRRMKV